jgi:hypothetical protein
VQPIKIENAVDLPDQDVANPENVDLGRIGEVVWYGLDAPSEALHPVPSRTTPNEVVVESTLVRHSINEPALLEA